MISDIYYYYSTDVIDEDSPYTAIATMFGFSGALLIFKVCVHYITRTLLL